MGNSRHIFIQIDTNSIIALGKSEPTNEEVRAHTMIYDQGSLALGNAVKSFTIEVKEGQELHFSIIPLELFTYSKVYFTAFEIIKPSKMKVPSMKPKGNVLSFIVPISEAGYGGSADFCLNAVIETQNGEHIKICIDPRLQTEQGGG